MSKPKEKYISPMLDSVKYSGPALSAACKYQAVFQLYDCPLDIGNAKLFSDGNICELTDAGGDGKVCSHISIDEEKVFGS